MISLTIFSLAVFMARVFAPSLIQKVSSTITVSPLFCEVEENSSPAQDARKRHRDSSSARTERDYRVLNLFIALTYLTVMNVLN